MAKDTKNGSLGEAPLCIRFKRGYLDRIDEISAREGMTRSTWIREAAVQRAEQVNKRMGVEMLEYVTAGGTGEQICVRFRPDEFEKIKRAAMREKALPSPWIRAVIVHRVDTMNGTEPAKDKTVKEERRKSGTRVRVKDGPKRIAAAR